MFLFYYIFVKKYRWSPDDMIQFIEQCEVAFAFIFIFDWLTASASVITLMIPTNDPTRQ